MCHFQLSTCLLHISAKAAETRQKNRLPVKHQKNQSSSTYLGGEAASISNLLQAMKKYQTTRKNSTLAYQRSQIVIENPLIVRVAPRDLKKKAEN
jgi:hypothetical protein